jgi:ribosome production factor 2
MAKAKEHFVKKSKINAAGGSRFSGKNKKNVKLDKRKRGHTVRALKAREPKLIEDSKKALFIRGQKTSQRVCDAMLDLRMLKAPDGKFLGKRNPLYAFEDETSVEFLCQKNDCSLFVLGNHNKKRPHNLIFGRMFGYPEFHLLDMIELGIDEYTGLVTDGAVKKKAPGSKPCFIFQGNEWTDDNNFAKLRSLFLDFFKGQEVDQICLAGLDHVIVCTAAQGKVHFRVHSIGFKKSGTKIPKVELSLMGPCMTLSFRRTKFASEDLYKLACKRPKELKVKKKKNISRNALGDKLGQVHMERQDFDKMNVRRVKALRNGGSRSIGEKKKGENPDPGGASKRAKIEAAMGDIEA